MSYSMHTPPTTAHGFDLTTNGNATMIRYKRAKYGIGLLISLAFTALIVVTIIGLLLHLRQSIWAASWLLSSFGLYVGLNTWRGDGSITINHDTILVRSRAYERSHMSCIILDEPGLQLKMAKSLNAVLLLFTGSLRESFQRHYAMNNHFIAFRYGEQMVTLAGGLREDTADVLYQQVLALMDFESY